MDWDPQGTSTIDTLKTRLCEQHYSRAAITGPHGSGKSTCLANLVPQLGQLAFRRDSAGQILQAPSPGTVVWLAIRRPLRSWPTDLKQVRWNSGNWLIVDGFEQLSPLTRWVTAYRVRRCGMGLLVTSHRQLSYLPTLIDTSMTLPRLRRLVSQRINGNSSGYSAAQRAELLDDAFLGRLLLEEQGNAREVFMRLYDWHEQQTTPQASRSVAKGPGWAIPPPA
ncbi:nucleoside/nucleotide kinase family protein [Aureliella helgolandensis]|uniref:AAA+ ATPase domain-containing protein n=1 Tax=Aureliella helgolandensis TaxID=2527968 RepID=A0A518GGC5_9BACT|nr:hypothetical protein [Aureliella helgolandensis]QDV27598.1 hypothetical protein Q31a_59900 [Aureliella helgolandensis]